MFGSIIYGLNVDSESLYLKMCRAAGYIRETEDGYWYPSIRHLKLEYSVSPDEAHIKDLVFNAECEKWYYSLEEDDYSPSKEICAILAIMSQRGFYRNPTEEKWTVKERL